MSAFFGLHFICVVVFSLLVVATINATSRFVTSFRKLCLAVPGVS